MRRIPRTVIKKPIRTSLHEALSNDIGLTRPRRAREAKPAQFIDVDNNKALIERLFKRSTYVHNIYGEPYTKEELLNCYNLITRDASKEARDFITSQLLTGNFIYLDKFDKSRDDYNDFILQLIDMTDQEDVFRSKNRPYKPIAYPYFIEFCDNFRLNMGHIDKFGIAIIAKRGQLLCVGSAIAESLLALNDPDEDTIFNTLNRQKKEYKNYIGKYGDDDDDDDDDLDRFGNI